MKTRFDVGAIAFALLTLSMATVSHAGVPDDKRLRFEDEDGVEIESYCVAPLYAKYSGFRMLDGPPKTDRNLYLMWPVIVKKGDGGYFLNQKIKWPTILLKGLITTGESIKPDTLLLLKAGRAPLLTSYYTSQNATKTVVFPKGDSNAAIDLLTSDSVDMDAIRSLYATQADGYIAYGHRNRPIVYSYTKEEKEMLRTCYKK